MSFQYLDFNFEIINSQTCYIGFNSSKFANAPIRGESYSGPLIIPSIAVDNSTGRMYTVVATLKHSFKKCSQLKYVTLPDTL